MKKLFAICLAICVVVAISNFAWAACTTIQDGGLVDSAGNAITLGYDDFGYNYEAHMFNGRYCDYDRVIGGDYCDVDLIMKWNNEWLSNKDCDADGLLDRPSPYIGSGAWLTNHQSGWVDVNGKNKKWTYFVKIVAVPTGSVLSGGKWFTDNTMSIEIGPAIWGSFAIIQEIYNDPSVPGAHGISYKSPAGPGFGIYGKEGD